MQIVSQGDNLHEISNTVSWKKIKYLGMSSAEYLPSMLSTKTHSIVWT